MPGPLTPISRIRPPLWLLISKNGSFGEVPAPYRHPEAVSSCPNLGLASRLRKAGSKPSSLGPPSALSASLQASLPGVSPQSRPLSCPAASLRTEDTLSLPPACRGRNPRHLSLFCPTPTAAKTASKQPPQTKHQAPTSFSPPVHPDALEVTEFQSQSSS